MEGFHGDVHVSKLMFFGGKLGFYLYPYPKAISQRISDYFSFLADPPGNLFFEHHDGKLPEAGQKALAFFSVDEIPAILLDQSDGPDLAFHFSRWPFFPALFHSLPAAESFDRALRASRLGGDANHGAQVHQRLVEIRGSPGGNEFLDGVFQPLFLAGALGSLLGGPKRGSDSLNVSVERGYGLIEGNAGHCSGDVRAESREGKEFLFRRGDHAGVLGAGSPGPRHEGAGPARNNPSRPIL